MVQKLLKWITTQTSGYPGVQIRDLCSSWTDGLAFAALIHRYAPQDIPFDELSTSTPEECMLNLELAFSVAHSRFGVPSTLLPSDMLSAKGPDKIAVFSYLSSLYTALKKQKASGKPPKAKSPPSSSAKKLASYISPRRLMHRVVNSPAVKSPPAPAVPSTRASPGARFGPTAATSGKVALLRWCQKRAEAVYPASSLIDFRTCWQNGLALCAIAHSYFPQHVPFSTLSEKNSVANVTLAFDVLERYGGVPRLLDVEDVALVRETEPQSLMTYLSTARRVLEVDSSNPIRSPPPQVSPTSRHLVFQPDIVVPTAASVFQQPPVTPVRSAAAPPKTPAKSVKAESAMVGVSTPAQTPIKSIAKAQQPASSRTVITVSAPRLVIVQDSHGDDEEDEEEEEEEFPVTPIRNSGRKRAAAAPAFETPAIKVAPVVAALPATPLSAKRKRIHVSRKLDNLTKVSTEDLSKLPQLSLESMCSTLQERYARDEIYTWCGQILVSVNPYRPLSNMYGPQQTALHLDPSAAVHGMSPHVFALGRRVLDALHQKRSQSIVISGESGAGKTEATNILVSFFGASSAAPPGLQHRMMASSILLEAMGNAKTARNDNSSRFGKLFKICFSPDGSQLLGASVEAYLLELARVTGQAQGERNFHIFYQMCAGATAEEKNMYKIQPASQFAVLKGLTQVSSLNDGKDWVRFKDALSQLQVSADLQQDLFRMLSAILHLGNISFVESVGKGGSKQVELARDGSENALKIAAELLGLQPAALHGCLTRRIIKASARDSVVHKPLSQSQAKVGRDTLSRLLYSKLFFMVVDCINAALAPSQQKDVKEGNEGCLFVGLLDLFGFENFDTGNHFEQLMVNYANEKMQHVFLTQVLQQELKEYASENIAFQLQVPDNSMVVEMFEHRARGIISILDDECKIEDATAQSFIGKLQKEWGSSSCLEVPKMQGNKPSFVVNHYAEAVTYSTHAFRSHNQHVLRDDLMETVALGGRPLLGKLFKAELEGERGGRAGKVTVGRRFRASLQELSAMLASTVVSWIRCVKPNSKQKPQAFDPVFVTKQLTYLGMLSVAQLRQDGYPIRVSFVDFCARYSACADVRPPASGSDLRKASLYLIDKLTAATAVTATRSGKRAFYVGSSRMFLSQELWDACEDLKEEKEEEEKRKKEEEERKRLEEEKEKKLKADMEKKRLLEIEKKKEYEKLQQERNIEEQKEKKAAQQKQQQERKIEEQKELPRPTWSSSGDKPLLFKKLRRPEPEPVAPVVVMLQSVSASLQGSLQGSFSILQTRLQENLDWCDAVLQSMESEEVAPGGSALSSMRFGRYPDVLSPERYEPASEAAKRSLRRTLRKSPGQMEVELAAIREEKTRLEQEVATLRVAKADKSHDRKMLEAELESARLELNAIKRGRVEDALRRRAAIGGGSGPALKKLRSPDKLEEASTPKRRPSPPKGRQTPNRVRGRTPAGKAAVVPSPVPMSTVSCAACQGAISGKGVMFQENEFHANCFKCAACSVDLAGKAQVISVADLPYCSGCGHSAFAKHQPLDLEEESRLRDRIQALNKKEEELRIKEEQLALKEARERQAVEDKARQKQALIEQRGEKERRWAENQQKLQQERIVEEQKRRESMVKRIQELHAAEAQLQSEMSTPVAKSPRSLMSHQPLFGLDAELSERVKAKNKDSDWEEAVTWVESIVGENGEARHPNETGETHFWKVLRSGSMLCQLLNTLFPNTITRMNKNKGGIALAERENIQLYINGCLEVGVPSHETFSVADLYDAKYLVAVLTNLHALSRVAQAKGVEMHGHVLGVKVSNYNFNTVTKKKNPQSPRHEVLSNMKYHRGRQ